MHSSLYLSHRFEADHIIRLCCVQSKNQAIAVHGYDVDLDGVDELITGWSNGKVNSIFRFCYITFTTCFSLKLKMGWSKEKVNYIL